jgi:single-strand DNA-binding protein
MSVNKVMLVGRLGRDPETRYTGGGQAVANFSVATDETYKDRNGERQKRTEWHKIVVWGKQAEIAQQYLKRLASLHRGPHSIPRMARQRRPKAHQL